MKKSKIMLTMGALSMAACGLFAGCGASQIDTVATIDKGGNWEAATASAAVDYVNKEEVSTSIETGYHLSMKGKMGEMTTFVNAYIVVDENGIPTGSAIKMEVKTSAEEYMLYTVYVKDGVMYTLTDIKSPITNANTKFKVTLGEGEHADKFLSGEEMEDMELLVTADQYLYSLSTISAGKEDKFAFEKSTSGKTTKYRAKLKEKIEIDQFGTKSTYDTSEMYIVFEDNAFVGASLEQKGTATFEGETVESNSTIAITTFNGNISYPSFDGYKEIPNLFN